MATKAEQVTCHPYGAQRGGLSFCLIQRRSDETEAASRKPQAAPKSSPY